MEDEVTTANYIPQNQNLNTQGYSFRREHVHLSRPTGTGNKSNCHTRYARAIYRWEDFPSTPLRCVDRTVDYRHRELYRWRDRCFCKVQRTARPRSRYFGGFKRIPSIVTLVGYTYSTSIFSLLYCNHQINIIIISDTNEIIIIQLYRVQIVNFTQCTSRVLYILTVSLLSYVKTARRRFASSELSRIVTSEGGKRAKEGESYYVLNKVIQYIHTYV